MNDPASTTTSDTATQSGSEPARDTTSEREDTTRWWDSGSTRAPRARPPVASPIYRAEDEFSAIRRRFGFRGATVGFAGQVIWGRFIACAPDGTGECTGDEPTYYRVQGTPTIDLLGEFGGRWARFVLGVYSSPVLIAFEDWGTSIFIGVRAGALFGNERVRFGATAGGGFLGWEWSAQLLITPIRARTGHRFGVAVGAGQWGWLPSITLGLRVAPAALNHRGGRRAARERGRAAEAAPVRGGRG